MIDEVSDIALQCGLRSAFYKNLIRLSSKGAAFGLILVLATQNPKAEVLNTLIRGNMSTRIAFRVSSVEHSRTILGLGGAQKLPRTIRGRMLARLDESLVELQGFYVSDEAVLALARALGGVARRVALAGRARAGGLCAARTGRRVSRPAAVRAVQGRDIVPPTGQAGPALGAQWLAVAAALGGRGAAGDGRAVRDGRP